MQELDILYLNQLFTNFCDCQENLRKEISTESFERKELALKEKKLAVLNSLITNVLKLKQIIS